MEGPKIPKKRKINEPEQNQVATDEEYAAQDHYEQILQADEDDSVIRQIL
jgi:hypothetical protein